ncbi:hypothetical protein E4U42_004772 [Claviceps africana]|uniref:Nicotinamide-nucleotide adenylyltransferase n=1 Tax=Claviceps africana TaxID=83212 RepID=A0A8K0J4N7_9HYPO|nr:hypothetical protein E4U42_004772 [Claviceps africana]
MPPSVTRSLAAFISSPDPFRILTTCTPTPPPPTRNPPQTLIVLDSSFNPPTTAHAHMALSAIHAAGPNTRLLLLLAVRNADKGSPGDLAPRLRLMQALARDLHDDGAPVPVDVAVTKMALFGDKARCVPAAAEHVYLCGFDTLVRMLDARYYAGEGGMRASLGGFFAAARLRVTVRPGGGFGGEDEQRAFVEGLGTALGGMGGDAAWAARVELVEGGGGFVSSSRVRDVVGRGGGGGGELDGLVGWRVRRVMEEEGLYGMGGGGGGGGGGGEGQGNE